MDTNLERALNSAIANLQQRKDYKPHKHSERCMNVLRDVLGKDEQTILEIKQSLLMGLAPDRIVATNKRLIIVRPSFWKLYTGHNIIGPTEASFVPYHNLISVITSKGRIFATVHIRIHGFADESKEMKKEGRLTGCR
jgi:hypothetical protein